MSKNTDILPERIKYLSIEGVIGAGKTTLCRMIADKTGARTILEEADGNPFLEGFYQDRQSMAFQTQLWFLLSRYKQLTQDFSQQDLFYSGTISDYIFAKDSLFASINLDENELSMYNSVANIMKKEVPIPDFVIYLQTSTEVLMKRIEKRGRLYESDMDREYIEKLNEAYNHFFFHYKDSPVLIINTDELDFVENQEDFDEIIEQVHETKWGSNYYSPLKRSERNLLKNMQSGDES